MNTYLEVLKKYAVFSGRAPRKEYWMFALFNVIISFGLGLLFGIISGVANTDLSMLAHLYTLAVLCPSIGVGIRRLHDTGRAGWWMLLAFIPLVGPIVLLVFMCMDSEPGDNRFGPNPKMIGQA